MADEHRTVKLFTQIFGSHSENLRRSLDKTSQRHSMVSTNIANVNVPGYKRQDMDFSIQLDDAMGERRIDRLASRFGGLDPASQSSVRVDGNSVDIEHEVVSLTEMQIRYQALTDMTSRHFKGLKNVIKGGR